MLRASKELKRLYKFSSRDDLLKGEVKQMRAILEAGGRKEKNGKVKVG